MKKHISLRVSATAAAVLILFTAVFSVCVFANAVSEFTPRLTEPDSTNEYYYSDKNIFYKYGYGMPNCTAYAFGRAYELLGEEPSLSHGNAEKWYDYNKDGGYYSYGQTPKLGAIACWSYSGGGHVAVVEKIEDGTITFSNSGWNYKNFYLTAASTSDSSAGQSSWTFQGYIYIGDFSGTSTTEDVGESSCKTGIYEVDVTTTLNMRSGAGTSYSYVVSIPDGALLTVTQIQSAGGYTWGYTTYNGNSGWVALDYCIYISDAESETEAATESASDYESAVLKGDIDGDGAVTVSDASLIQKSIVGATSLDDSQLELCDFNGDGHINVVDVTDLQKYIVGIAE